ncbi:Hypothetical predicted protein [Olea europaea subsp. europaea]|uniref:Uncharacterized protein n=1 Tax=Olea europaea subsp. europaea TaxID=158383 RepID=A0A8S0UWG0_OLEEU|nr:Hypothetical predicted protein [Olea europaea subsp. europaea]
MLERIMWYQTRATKQGAIPSNAAMAGAREGKLEAMETIILAGPMETIILAGPNALAMISSINTFKWRKQPGIYDCLCIYV